MTSAPTNPLDVPPYQLQPLVASVTELHGIEVRCAQALGSEIYVGCSDGELFRFALQADDPNKPEVYSLLSRQSMPLQRPIDDIVLVPSIGRALILIGHQIHFYTLPSLDPIQSINPLRNVVTFAVDEQHLRRPPLNLSNPSGNVEPIDLCIIKRTSITLYQLRERLLYGKDIPLPQGATLARRTGKYLCVADKEFYNIIDLEKASMVPLLPLTQAPDPDAPPVKPRITVISENEFLIVSWTGASALGVFITGEGDPVRGTLEWPAMPESMSLDYPYITTLLPNHTIEIHNIETQTIVQVVPAPATPASPKSLAAAPNRYLVPSRERTDKMRTVPVKLLRGPLGVQASGMKVSHSLPPVTPV